MPRPAVVCTVYLSRDKAGVLHACLGIDVHSRPVRRAPRGKLNEIQRHPDGSCSLHAQLLFRVLRCRKPFGVGAKQRVLVVHQGADPLESLGLVPGQSGDLDCKGRSAH